MKVKLIVVYIFINNLNKNKKSLKQELSKKFNSKVLAFSQH